MAYAEALSVGRQGAVFVQRAKGTPTVFLQINDTRVSLGEDQVRELAGMLETAADDVKYNAVAEITQGWIAGNVPSHVAMNMIGRILSDERQTDKE